ncbi:MAG: hypothetical protein ABL967_07385 [Bryobacteraceae bacterium]
MKKAIAIMVLAASSMFAGVAVGVRIGAPPAPRAIGVRPVAPGPRHVWVDGYWYPSGNRYLWRSGYWAAAPYRGSYWVAPRWDRGMYFAGYWAGGNYRR